jgi:hypothetical protein
MLYAILYATAAAIYFAVPWAWTGMEIISTVWDLRVRSGRGFRQIYLATRLWMSSRFMVEEEHWPYFVRGKNQAFRWALLIFAWPLFMYYHAEDLHQWRRCVHTYTVDERPRLVVEDIDAGWFR